MSDGKAHLRHWGILITEIPLVDARAILLRTIEDDGVDVEETELGTMYEVFRDDEDRHNINITRLFRMTRKRGRTADFQYVGESEVTHSVQKSKIQSLTMLSNIISLMLHDPISSTYGPCRSKRSLLIFRIDGTKTFKYSEFDFSFH